MHFGVLTGGFGGLRVQNGEISEIRPSFGSFWGKMGTDCGGLWALFGQYFGHSSVVSGSLGANFFLISLRFGWGIWSKAWFRTVLVSREALLGFWPFLAILWVFWGRQLDRPFWGYLRGFGSVSQGAAVFRGFGPWGITFAKVTWIGLCVWTPLERSSTLDTVCEFLGGVPGMWGAKTRGGKSRGNPSG